MLSGIGQMQARIMGGFLARLVGLILAVLAVTRKGIEMAGSHFLLFVGASEMFRRLDHVMHDVRIVAGAFGLGETAVIANLGVMLLERLEMALRPSKMAPGVRDVLFERDSFGDFDFWLLQHSSQKNKKPGLALRGQPGLL